jgi:hypothetical protein
MSDVIHGACLCGRVTFDVNEPESLGVCHCSRCQRWTGSGNSAVVIVEPKNFKVTKGRESLKLYQEAKFADRHFCGNCGSGVYVDGGSKYYVGAGSEGREAEAGVPYQVFPRPVGRIGGTRRSFPVPD